MVERAIRSKLGEITTIASRIYPLSAPEGVDAPYVTYEQTGYDPFDTLTGSSDIHGADYDISVFSASYGELKTLTASAMAKLRTMERQTIDGTTFDSVGVEEDDAEYYDPKAKIRRKTIHLSIIYTEV